MPTVAPIAIIVPAQATAPLVVDHDNGEIHGKTVTNLYDWF
jgi:hypothetical protein